MQSKGVVDKVNNCKIPCILGIKFQTRHVELGLPQPLTKEWGLSDYKFNIKTTLKITNLADYSNKTQFSSSETAWEHTGKVVIVNI